MEDNTTQPQVENLAPPQAEVESAATPTEPTTEQQPETEPTSFKLKVKYNKDEIELDQDMAVEYAQKGMNYDKVFERAKSLESELERAKRAALVFDEIATEGNITYDEAIERTQKQRLAAKAQRENKPLGQVEAEERARLEKERADRFETDQKTRERKAGEWEDFHEAFPDVKPDDLPDNVFEAWTGGDEPLLKLYKLHKYDEVQSSHQTELQTLQERIKEMEDKLNAQKINAENADAAPGKLGGGDTEHGELTMEDIDKMTPAEIEKNIDKVWAVYTKK